MNANRKDANFKWNKVWPFKKLNLDLRSYGQILSLFDSARIITEKNMIYLYHGKRKKNKNNKNKN